MFAGSWPQPQHGCTRMLGWPAGAQLHVPGVILLRVRPTPFSPLHPAPAPPPHSPGTDSKLFGHSSFGHSGPSPYLSASQSGGKAKQFRSPYDSAAAAKASARAPTGNASGGHVSSQVGCVRCGWVGACQGRPGQQPAG